MASMTKIFHHSPYATISPTDAANSQAGKTVLIAGAATGIGFAIAQAFVEAKASRVVLTGRRPEVLERAASELRQVSNKSEVLAFAVDLNVESSVRNLWQRLLLEDIAVDVLILNAADASSGPVVPLKDFLPSLQKAFGLNLFANTYMASSFLEQPVDKSLRKPKALINISTFAAHANPSPMQGAYSTSKAAFAHTLQLLADEITADECQIINVHPGAIQTEAVAGAPREILDAVVWDEAELPGAFAVWASTSQASFLHGRFVWANWDVKELEARTKDFADPGFLKFGLQGAEHVDRTTIFDKIRGLNDM